MTVSGHIAACEKDGQTVVSASLSVDVEVDTWLGRKTLKGTIPNFDLNAGTTTQTLYVHELSEGTVWIKAQPDLSTSRVSLWAGYTLNKDGFCAYIVSDKLSLGVSTEDSDAKAFTVTEGSSSGGSSKNTGFYIGASVGAAIVIFAAFGGFYVYRTKYTLGEEDIPEAEMAPNALRHGKTTMSIRWF